MEHLYQGIPERPCLLCDRGFGAPPLTSQGHGCLKESEAARAFPIPEEGSSHSKPLGTFTRFFSCSFVLFLTYSFVAYVQAIQEVFVAKEWVNDARNEARVEDNRALGAAEQKNKELACKLVAKERARLLRWV